MENDKFPDVALVRATARATWEASERKKIGLQERIGASVPWWLVLIAGVFFALSAPHTTATFDKLTPGWGWVAPWGVEFGLLYAAFRRKQARANKESVTWTLWGLEILLGLTAVVVNGAGSFIAVVESVSIGKLPLSAIGSTFATLPAVSQVALMLVIPAAIIIPLGTGVAGEGLAALILERRRTGDILEMRWRPVAAEVEFTALRDAAVQAGVSPAKAKAWAAGLVAGRTSPPAPLQGGEGREKGRWFGGGRPEVSARTDADNGHADGQRTTGQVIERPAMARYARRGDAREVARQYLADNPDAINVSVREFAQMCGIGKTVAAEVMAEKRQE